MRAEILYEARIKPDRILCQLNAQEISNLWEISIRIIRKSYEAHGLTIRSYWDPYGRKGSFEVQVYEKEVDPHGFKVVKSQFKDKRSIHWVPELQK